MVPVARGLALAGSVGSSTSQTRTVPSKPPETSTLDSALKLMEGMPPLSMAAAALDPGTLVDIPEEDITSRVGAGKDFAVWSTLSELMYSV